MKLFFFKKTVTALIFVGILFILSILNFKTAYPAFKQNVLDFFEASDSNPEELSALATKLDHASSENVFKKSYYIEAYGYIQKVLGKNEINNFEVVKAKDGSLNYTYFTTGPNDVSTLVKRMQQLQQACIERGSKLMYLMTPDKYIVGSTKYEKGLPYNYANETADNFLAALTSKHIDALDFRKFMKEDGIYTTDSFYKTDHHWKIETAFWAYTKLIDQLEDRYGFPFPNDELYKNLDNYNQIVYKDRHIGSMGRKEGILYSGTDDFTFIYPKFETNFFLYAQDGSKEITSSGSFEQSICFPALLSGDNIYDSTNDKYFTYMAGNPGYVAIKNNNNTNGPRVLFIKDSLIVPVASFFALDCSEIVMVDPRYYYGNVEDVVTGYDFDYVFVSFSPQNLTEEFFPFYKNQ